MNRILPLCKIVFLSAFILLQICEAAYCQGPAIINNQSRKNFTEPVIGAGYAGFQIRNGRLWGFGYNPAGGLGIGNTVTQYTPVPIGTGNNWKKITGGFYFTLGIKADGTLWAWGDNSSGQLGIGNITNQLTPVQVGAASNWVNVCAGASHVLAIKADGSLWAWGFNQDGELGINNRIDQNSPVRVGAVSNWVKIACGSNQSYAIQSNGTLWAWGNGHDGAMGNGYINNQLTPFQVGFNSNWVSIAAEPGSLSVMGIQSDGTMWSWGRNDYSQLGLSNTSPSFAIPIQVGTDHDWISASIGISHAVALKSNGTIWATGSNASGQLGIAGATIEYSFTRIGTDTNWVSIAAGSETLNTGFSIGMKSDGTVWSWGNNLFGELGQGNAISTQYAPLQLIPATNDDAWLTISNCEKTGHALKSDGTIWSWGNNINSTIGIGYTVNDLRSRVQTGTDNKWTFISATNNIDPSYSCFVFGTKTNGTLWSWGSTVYGGLGTGGAAGGFANHPMQVGTANNWLFVSGGGAFALGIRSNGSLWSWGANDRKQLGLIDNVDRYTPVQVEFETKWTQVSAGGNFSMALKSNGTLWSWGDNIYGQLGIGITTDQWPNPKKVNGDTDWVAVSAGAFHCIALKADGTIWSWGNNDSSQLGLGNNTSQNIPQKIGNDNDWVGISTSAYSSYAVKANGTVWSWGSNNFGQLGLVNYNRQNLPAQVPNQQNVIQAGRGLQSKFNTILKADRQYICGSGDNTRMELGDNSGISVNFFNCYNYNCLDYALPSNYALTSQNMGEINTPHAMQHGCKLIASVVPKTNINWRSTKHLEGNVWVESAVPVYGGQPFVQRHWQFRVWADPAFLESVVPARFTFYVTQQEFDNFNNHPAALLKLPSGPNDAAGIANLRIGAYNNNSDDNSGLPGSYHFGSTVIKPSAADIVWNPRRNWWEISIDIPSISYTGVIMGMGFIVQTALTALPLKLQSFTAIANPDNTALLRWKVTDQSGIKEYAVERSGDGIQFNSIGTVKANTMSDYTYHFTDQYPLTGLNYYRLRITEWVKESYSQVERLRFDNNGGGISVFPVPAGNVLHLRIGNSNLLNTDLRILDLTGKLQMIYRVNNLNGDINIGNLAVGNYIIECIDGTHVRFVKQ